MREHLIHILVGLPGSGKTWFAEQFVKETPSATLLSLDPWVGKVSSVAEALRKAQQGRPTSVTRFAQVVVDGLFLTPETIQEVMDAFADEFLSIRFILHQWDEDRKTCERNDENRRDQVSLLTIRKGSYPVLDPAAFTMRHLQTMTVDPEIIRHKVELKPAWYRYHANVVGRDGKLRSPKYMAGGMMGNCWDSSYTYLDGEAIPPFHELHAFVKRVYPDLLASDWFEIEPKVVTQETTRKMEYYGGHSTYIQWVCDIPLLEQLIEEKRNQR